MPLYLSNEDVAALVDVGDAIAALEAAFADWGTDGAANAPRQRVALPQRAMNVMAASWAGGGVCGHKAYFGGCHYVSLYSIGERRLLALIEAATLGAMRTGAASGVATRLLARHDAKTVGLIGTGRQARTQLQAVAAVRGIEHVRVFGRDAEKRAAFAGEMESLLNCAVEPSESAETAIRDADIAITATNSAEPVLSGAWLSAGAHVNAIGANGYARRELDDDAMIRTDVIVTDQRDQAKGEARELIDLASAGALDWDEVIELGALVRGEATGRTDDGQVTLFKSLGIALEDIAFAKTIYERALHRGVGSRFGPAGKETE